MNRKERMKEIILSLHAGESMENAKNKFQEIFQNVNPDDIAAMEQDLIDSGELTAEQVTELCDVHVEVMKNTIDISNRPDLIPGHPLHTYKRENALAREFIAELKKEFSEEKFAQLSEIIVHYTRLQNQLFPKLEQKGFRGPSQVMWTKQDQIRDMFRSKDPLSIKKLLKAIKGMITKEEKILFPTSYKKLTEQDWIDVKKGEEEIGFAWIKPGNDWKPISPKSLHMENKLTKEIQNSLENPLIPLDTGKMPLKFLNLMLKHLPIDLSFINEKDEVMYYSDVTHRIFPRSPGVIGRNVMNCHPPKSHHIVQKILSAFKEGKKDEAEFWLTIDTKLIYIRYFAVRDENGNYAGTLEVSQDITQIKNIEGTRRLLNWEEET